MVRKVQVSIGDVQTIRERRDFPLKDHFSTVEYSGRVVDAYISDDETDYVDFYRFNVECGGIWPQIVHELSRFGIDAKDITIGITQIEAPTLRGFAIWCNRSVEHFDDHAGDSSYNPLAQYLSQCEGRRVEIDSLGVTTSTYDVETGERTDYPSDHWITKTNEVLVAVYPGVSPEPLSVANLMTYTRHWIESDRHAVWLL